MDQQTWVLLNGLPRHAGQAKDMEGLVDVKAVVELTCATDVVLERLRLNTGGDRSERNDDHEALVMEKLKTYRERTRYLVDAYRERGARIIPIDIRIKTQPPEIAHRIPAL